MTADYSWTEEGHAELRKLWAEGLSCVAIGKRMGVSKNSIVGKSHRLNLPRRLSPIKGRALKPLPARAPASTLPTLAVWVDEAAIVDTAPAPLPEPPAMAPTPIPARRLSSTGCQFITGRPGHGLYSFCGADTDLGHSWCEAHRRVVFVRPQKRDFVDYHMVKRT